MTTAISLWLVIGGAIALLRRVGRFRRWPPARVRGSASSERAPLSRGALRVHVAVVRARMVVPRGASAGDADRIRGERPTLLGRAARDRPFRPQHGALSLRDGGSGAGARACVRSCCSTACCAMPARCAGCAKDLVARQMGPVYTMSYGPPLESIELFVDQVAAKIDAILVATGASRVALVGHSMGGLVGRAYLRRHGAAKVSYADDARHAAPRQRPRLALPGDVARAAAARATRGSPSSIAPKSAPGGHSHRVAVVMARLDGRPADERATRRRREHRAPRHRPQRARREPPRVRARRGGVGTRSAAAARP